MITLLLLVRATYMYGVVLHAHPVRGESHNQRNTTGEVATRLYSLLVNPALVTTITAFRVFRYFTALFSQMTARTCSKISAVQLQMY